MDAYLKYQNKKGRLQELCYLNNVKFRIVILSKLLHIPILPRKDKYYFHSNLILNLENLQQNLSFIFYN
jgi:hypothetical protein